MRDAVLAHLSRGFDLHRELAEALPVDAFVERLPAPSNTIGAQFWCVVGGRESYTRAIADGAWAGFSCSLTSEHTRQKAAVIESLARSAELFAGTIDGLAWDDLRDGLLLDLLEHEAQHQGQLIRYVYALGFRFPEGWVERWALGPP